MRRSVRAALAWAGAAVVVLGVATLIVASAGEQPLLALNPLDVPVTIRFGDQVARLPAGGQRRLTVPVGALDVVVEAQDGRVLDRHALQVPASAHGQGIYAVLGAAPLYRINVVYSSRADAARPGSLAEAGFAPLMGRRFQLVTADYVLQEPPSSLQMPSGASRVVKTRVALFDGGWRTALQLVGENGDLAATYALARRLRRAFPADLEAIDTAVEAAAVLEGPDGAVAEAEEGLAGAPGSGDLHREYARAMRVAGRLAELRARYRELAARTPHAPAVVAQDVRVRVRAEAEAAARAALAELPDDPEVLLAAGYALLRLGRSADAAALYARLPAGPSRDVDSAVRAFLAAGRARDALALGLAAARAPDAGAEDVARYVRLTRVVPAAAKPEATADEVLQGWAGQDGDTRLAWAHAALGELEPSAVDAVHIPASHRAALGIAAWAVRDPEKALAACAEAPDVALLHVPAELGALLALEAWRAGDRAAYRRLAQRLPVSEAEVAAWIERGVEPEEAWRFDDDERSAFALVRARRLRAAGQPVPPAFSAAARSDPLRGLVWAAAAAWPEPARAAPPARLVLQP